MAQLASLLPNETMTDLPSRFYISPDSEGTFNGKPIIVCPMCGRKGVIEFLNHIVHGYERKWLRLVPFDKCIIIV